MPTTIYFKYNKFKGNGSQDMDDWLMEFESIVLANQEEPGAKRRIFQGLLKGEALKWYQDVLDQIQNKCEQLTLFFLYTF